MKHPLPLLLVLVLAVAGCTSLQQQKSFAPKASAVSIKSFTSDMGTVYTGGDLTLSLLLENEGAFEAQNVESNLYLYDGFTPSTPPASTTPPTNFWLQKRSKMRPPDSALKVPGDTYEHSWALIAPTDIGSAIKEYPFTFKVDVGYDYQSSALAQVPLLKYSRVQQLQQSKQSLPKSKTDQFPSPISIDVNFQEPVLFRQKGDPVDLNVVLNHKEGGFVKQYADPDNKDEMGCSCCGDEMNCIQDVKFTLPASLKIPEGSRFPTLCGGSPIGSHYTVGPSTGFECYRFRSFTPDTKNFKYHLKADVCGQGGTDGEVQALVIDGSDEKEAGRVKPMHLTACPNTKNWETDVTDYLPTQGAPVNIKFKSISGANAIELSSLQIVPACDFIPDPSNPNSLVAKFVKLVDGKQAALKCRLMVADDSSDELYPNFKVDSVYRYHVAGEKSVKVIKGG